MYKKYIASRKDLFTIESALNILWDEKLDFIFKHKERIVNASIVSFDSKNIYLWTGQKNKYNLTKIPHNLKKIDYLLHKSWMSGIFIEEFEEIINNNTKKKIFGPSGGLLTPFVQIHKKLNKIARDPYFTKESYVATIIHEFGHVYSGKLDKYGELFAMCAEYTASSIFWPNHKKNLDKFMFSIKDQLTMKNQNEDPHYFAFANFEKLITKHPTSWSDVLLNISPNF